MKPGVTCCKHQYTRRTLLVLTYGFNIVDEAHCVKKWGDSFRREFSHLGEVKSLISHNVNLMALTATATKTTRKSICRVLGMKKSVVVAESPNKTNIRYSVVPKSSTIEETFAPLAEEVGLQRVNVNKTIIFCRSYDSVTHIYQYFKSQLGKGKTEPPGLPDIWHAFESWTCSLHAPM